MTNPFPQSGAETPPGFKIITPSDVADLNPAGRAIILASEGAVRITDLRGVTTTIPSGLLAAKTRYYMPIARIHDTGTTSGLVIGVWG